MIEALQDLEMVTSYISPLPLFHNCTSRHPIIIDFSETVVTIMKEHGYDCEIQIIGCRILQCILTTFHNKHNKSIILDAGAIKILEQATKNFQQDGQITNCVLCVMTDEEVIELAGDEITNRLIERCPVEQQQSIQTFHEMMNFILSRLSRLKDYFNFCVASFQQI